MIKKLVTTIFVLSMAVLSGCASNSNTDGDAFGKTIYLRGEMNGWTAKPENSLKQIETGLYFTVAELEGGKRYKFKFADMSWSCGTNFGYRAGGDGIISLDVDPTLLNDCSKYEDLKFTPELTGSYEFYLDVRGEKPSMFVKAL